MIGRGIFWRWTIYRYWRKSHIKYTLAAKLYQKGPGTKRITGGLFPETISFWKKLKELKDGGKTWGQVFEKGGSESVGSQSNVTLWIKRAIKCFRVENRKYSRDNLIKINELVLWLTANSLLFGCQLDYPIREKNCSCYQRKMYWGCEYVNVCALCVNVCAPNCMFIILPVPEV